MMRLVKTCESDPEQYDVFCGNVCVGFLHLRHNRFTAALYEPEIVVYATLVKGDGEFEVDEREVFLQAGLRALELAVVSPPGEDDLGRDGRTEKSH